MYLTIERNAVAHRGFATTSESRSLKQGYSAGSLFLRWGQIWGVALKRLEKLSFFFELDCTADT